MKFFKMKTTLIIFLLLVANFTIAQKDKKAKLALTNVVIIGQMDAPADRYSIEINLSELFANRGIKTVASLNLMKLGSDPQQLASDSVTQQVKAKGFDTFVLVSVRGFDKRFKTSNFDEDFTTSMGRANLFQLYQEDVVSVSFEFKFFRGGKMVHSEIVKCGNAGSREKVLKKLRKKVGKLIDKKWK